jgi:hypothetical protein
MNQEIINKFASYLAALPEGEAFAAMDIILEAFISDRPGHIIYYGSDLSPHSTVQAIIQLVQRHDDPQDAMSIIMALLLTFPKAMIDFADLGEHNAQIQDLKDAMQAIVGCLRSFDARIKAHMQTVS